MARPDPHARETAAAHLVARVATARPDETVADAIVGLRGQSLDSVEAVYVLDDAGRLIGLVRTTDLLRSPGERRLGEIVERDPPAVLAGEDQERIADRAIARGIAAVPVVDGEGRLLGVVPPEALIAILRREHIEDLHRLTGIQREEIQAREAIEAPPLRRARHRLPWLLVGLSGSIVATLVMSRYENILEARIAVAFFVPGIVYLADAIGTQTEAIAVRGLSLSQARFRHLLVGEMSTGLLIGLALGALVYLAIILIGVAEPQLALAVGVATLAAGTAATTIGLLLPWFLSQAGRDPAFGSGPVATVIQDVLSLVIYFAVVQMLIF